MQLETIHFPSDRDNVFGHLSREMTAALHKASEHPDHADLLEEFFKFGAKKLKEARKEYKDRQALLKRRAEEKAAADAEANRKNAALRREKVVKQIDELTETKTMLDDVIGDTDGEEK